MMATAYYNSPVGLLRLRCDDESLKELTFIDDADEDVARDKHPLLNETIGQLDDYFSGALREFNLPLKQSGSEFQQKVWTLLSQIPYGKTVSYQQLSKQYGDPKAIRAVASANGRNNLAIIIPCHRVIGADRSLTGYAGGMYRKWWLLKHEAKWAGGVRELTF